MTDGGNRLLELQKQRNAQSRDAQESYAGHRAHVMELCIPAVAGSAGRLCLVGAGNCNDVDLTPLLANFSGIDLVDWDADAVAAAVRKQDLQGDERISTYGGVDVTGIASELACWSPSQLPNRESIEGWLRQAAEAPLPVPKSSCRTAVSLCLLSQLVEMCLATLGESHPRVVDLVRAVRLGHLRQLAGALAPGGQGIIVTDLVSSDSVPGLREVPPENLPALLQRLLSERNFFTGLHPASLLDAFHSDPVLSATTAEPHVAPPWLWSLGPRTYAVHAVTFRRR